MFFGTDGIRGEFGVPPLDQDTVVAIGSILSAWLAEFAGPRPCIVMAGDTRESTPALAAWLFTGLVAGQRDIRDIDLRWAGVLPTPAVAHLTRALGADLGIALSASHNPFGDNGIKLFSADGYKLDPSVERLLEQRFREHPSNARSETPSTPSCQSSVLPPIDPSLGQRYQRSLLANFRERPDSAEVLADLEVVLDTGNGAASALAGGVFAHLGAKVHVVFDQPNGRNINLACGSTAPEQTAALVSQHRANLGFAFDGDADRVIVIDERGVVRDGDEILTLLALDLLNRGELDPPCVVATSMSNLGLEKALEGLGVQVKRCDVGDRAVVRCLVENGCRLGGEPSGHLVDLERSTTGDGLLTALSVATIVRESKQPLSTLLANFKRFPQRLHNVVVKSKPPLREVPAIDREASAIERELAGNGRLVLRYSGTEQLARVMIEAEDQATVDRLTDRLARVIEQELG